MSIRNRKSACLAEKGCPAWIFFEFVEERPNGHFQRMAAPPIIHIGQQLIPRKRPEGLELEAMSGRERTESPLPKS